MLDVTSPGNRKIVHSSFLLNSVAGGQLIAACATAACLAAAPGYAGATPSGIGMTGLPSNLNGSGVNIGQVEATTASGGSGTQASPYLDSFEVSLPSSGPALTYIGNAPSYYYPNGASSPGNQPNVLTTTGGVHEFTVGSSSSYYSYGVSGHANSVGGYLWGANGVAPGISKVDNYDAGWFLNNVVGTYYSSHPGTYIPIATIHADQIVNQSFVDLFPSSNTTAQNKIEEQQSNIAYDAYSNYYGTLFVSAVGDGVATYDGGTYTTLAVNPPSTAYNSISVGASGLAANNATNGPTLTGLSSPDIITPGNASSYSTPQVSGAAALLVQAGNQINSSTGNTNATQMQTVKALLMNGADKQSNWAPTPGNSLSNNVGAGILDVYQSYQNLQAGEHAASAVNNSVTPITASTSVPLEGWNFATASSTGSNVSHYVFTLPTGATSGHLTATLVWNAQTSLSYSLQSIGLGANPSIYSLSSLSTEAFNSLYLYLYNATTGALVSKSDSTNDNTQTIFHSLSSLIPGDKYDLQVFDAGYKYSTTAPFTLNTSDPYALAWNVATPEPASLLLLVVGLVPLFLRRKVRDQ